MNKYILCRQATVTAFIVSTTCQNGRKNDNHLDERPLCRELNSRTSKAAAADFGTHARMLKTM